MFMEFISDTQTAQTTNCGMHGDIVQCNYKEDTKIPKKTANTNVDKNKSTETIILHRQARIGLQINPKKTCKYNCV